MHKSNPHKGQYNFTALCKHTPELIPFLYDAPSNRASIDFANAEAVYWLNKALMQEYLGIKKWALPKDSLCPAIPGRIDHIFYAAELLSTKEAGVPKGRDIHMLDIGTGANIIYPMIANRLLGWRCTGVDINEASISHGEALLSDNDNLTDIQLRLQNNRNHVLKGAILADDYFDLVVCNPPFHKSEQKAKQGSARKWRNLKQQGDVKLNFSGQEAELYCPGGEEAFIKQMIKESQQFRKQVGWFSSLVAQSAHLNGLKKAIKQLDDVEMVTINMAHGNKQSRLIAWRFN